MKICRCGEEIAQGRVDLGYTTCLRHGQEDAKQRRFTVVPMHKSNYVAMFNMDDLKGINNKGGLIK